VARLPARRFLAAFSLLLAAGAVAQTSALKGLDTSQPIDFSADRAEILNQQNLAILTGHVSIRQGKLTLTAERVRMNYTSSNGNTALQRLDARGSVKVTTPSETATGDVGVYDVGAKLITLTGNVMVRNRDGSQSTGQRIVWNLGTGAINYGARLPGQSSGQVTGTFVAPPRKP
jgi:lipopolysaccharide export system protein LptA